MKKAFLFFSIFAVLLFNFSSCKNKGHFLTSITGSPYEVLVVMDQKSWDSEAGKVLAALLNSDIPGLPQSEPTFDISHCIYNDFTSMLKPARNILFVEINPQKYTQSNVFLERDKWAQPQYIVKLVAPNDTSFINMINKRGKNIVDYIVKGEMDRYVIGLQSQKNKNFMDMVNKKFGLKMLIPATMSHYKKGKDFLWFSTGSGEVRKDLIIFTVPYTSKTQLSENILNNTRDIFTKKYIPGPVDNSYMGTEYKFDHPIYTVNNFNGSFCAQLRGLWKVYGNSFMGGPFVSYSMVDTVNQRVVTVDGFVYSPGKNKRQPIKELEAVINTVELPSSNNKMNNK